MAALLETWDFHCFSKMKWWKTGTKTTQRVIAPSNWTNIVICCGCRCWFEHLTYCFFESWRWSLVSSHSSRFSRRWRRKPGAWFIDHWGFIGDYDLTFSGGYLSAGRLKWDRGRFLRSFLKIHFHRFDSHAPLLACGFSGLQTQRTRFVGYTVTPWPLQEFSGLTGWYILNLIHQESHEVCEKTIHWGWRGDYPNLEQHVPVLLSCFILPYSIFFRSLFSFKSQKSSILAVFGDHPQACHKSGEPLRGGVAGHETTKPRWESLFGRLGMPCSF